MDNLQDKIIIMMTLYEFYKLYTKANYIYLAYKWVEFGYGSIKWIIGYKRKVTVGRNYLIEDDFVIVDID